MKIENYIENVRRDLVGFENIEYEDLYKSFKHGKLITVFSTVHHLTIKNFKSMNGRLPTQDHTSHFWADPSRELIKTIDTIRGLERALKNTRYSFKIDKYYDNVFKEVSNFLSNSGGSTIPENMDKIVLYYVIPLFIPVETIDIKSSHDNRISSKVLIGEGSYAFVYKYHDDFYNKKFVVKTAKDNLNSDELERFKIEFDTLDKFDSPYITEVYKYMEENNEYIMEYMDIDLHNYIQKNNSTITDAHRVNISRQILKGMEYIHSKKLFHRDISPKNILLKIYDDVVVVKVSDFGWVKDPENEMTNLDTAIKGYFNDHTNLARVGFNNYDMEHETFALTKLIVFVLTGKTNFSKIKNEKIKEFLDKGTSPKIDERFKSIYEISNHLKYL